MSTKRFAGLVFAGLMVAVAAAPPGIAVARMQSGGGVAPAAPAGDTADIWIHLYTSGTSTTAGFSWTGDLGNFTLHPSSGDESPIEVKASLPVGTYTVTESALSQWSVDSIFCYVNGGPDGTWSDDLSARKATMNVVAGEVEHCQFTNTWRRPDASIAKFSSAASYKGEDVYSKSVTSAQTQTAKMAKGTTISFFVRIDNDSPRADSFKVKGVATGSSKFAVSYYAGTTNISTAVKAGTYETSSISGSSTVTIEVRVKAASSTPAGAKRSVDMTVTSTSRPAQKDVVRAAVSRS